MKNSPISRWLILVLAGTLGSLSTLCSGRPVLAAPAPTVQLAQVESQGIDLRQLQQTLQQNPQLQEQALQLLQQNPELVMEMMQTLITTNPGLIDQLQQDPALVKQVAQQYPLLIQMLQQNPALVEQMHQLLE